MREKICGVYKITNNINGMSYIGQSIDCKQRWAGHKAPSAKRPIDLAIKEFGKKNFTFKILLECPPDMLDVWERDMINLHDSLYPNGYNYRGGGQSGFVSCEETRRKMSISQKNKPPMSNETRRRISESKKGEKNPNYGKPLSEEARRKISESLTGKMAGENNPFYNHKHTEEAKRKISEKNKGSKGYWGGKNRPEETRRKISKTLKGKPQPKPKWLTPSGEIREMTPSHVSRYHKDWIKIEE